MTAVLPPPNPLLGQTVDDEPAVPLAPQWVIYIVQTEDPSERFIGPFTKDEAQAWVDRYVLRGETWQRLVIAPLEAPHAAG